MIDDIKKTLWATADKLRANMDAAEYKHLVLGLIFVKYISDNLGRAARCAAPPPDLWPTAPPQSFRRDGRGRLMSVPDADRRGPLERQRLRGTYVYTFRARA